MGEIILKTARRRTSVSRQAVRNAVTGVFVNISHAKRDISSVKKSSGKKAAAKRK